MNRKKSKRSVWKYILGTFLLFMANLVHWATHWVLVEFGAPNFNTIIYHLNTDLTGTNIEPFVFPILVCIIISIIFSTIGFFISRICNSKEGIVFSLCKYKIVFPFDFWKRYYVVATTLLFVCSVFFNLNQLGLGRYAKAQMFPSKIFEEEYVPPQEVEITFPEEKRNLIYIFVEALETTYTSIEHGGVEKKNLIPELTKLQLENINFSTKDGQLHGAYVTTGSSWTVAAIISQTAGIPVFNGIVYDEELFFPGAYSIGQILEREGYKQVFLIGSEGDFAGRDIYMIQHGNYQIHDYNYAKEQGLISSDYQVFWGYEDKKLYENAKKELLKLSQEEKPFNLTMLTVDTHLPDGYLCELCENSHGERQYANVLSCADRQLDDFVKWIQEQDFYENTTIVISGDHTAYYCEADAKVYTTVINSAVPFRGEKERIYTTLDLYPTTLAAMGVEIEGERLGLGTNLFADVPTLIEKYGLEELDEELLKVSRYYQKNILNTPSEKE